MNTGNTISKKSRPVRARTPSDPSSWMVTFSDLLTLLLTLFVLRLSMSSLHTKEVEEQLNHFRLPQSTITQTGPKGGSRLEPVLQLSAPQIDPKPSKLAASIADSLGKTLGQPKPREEYGSSMLFSSEVRLKEKEGGVMLFLTGATFGPGSNELSFRAAETISAMAKSISRKDVTIRVRGHTDNLPISTQQFPSNWELSAARAIAVVRQMIDTGVDPAAISAVGYADTKPIASNQNNPGRHLNRRVEILITDNNTNKQ